METSVSIDATAHHMIHAQIDPIAWKTELERVAPKLRAQQMPSTNEWRAHVDQTVTTKAQIEKLMGDSANELFSMNKYVPCVKNINPLYLIIAVFLFLIVDN